MRIIISVAYPDQIVESMLKMGLSSTPPPLVGAKRVTGEIEYVYDTEWVSQYYVISK